MTPALEVELAYRACEDITRREAANFYYGIRLLPRDKREAMSAVYAFARRVDDIGDGDGDRTRSWLRSKGERDRLAAVAEAAVGGPAPATWCEDSVSVGPADAATASTSRSRRSSC